MNLGALLNVRAPLSCDLCAAIVDSQNPEGQREPFNTPLAESARFVVLPSIGPLVPGHIMVVSREHYPNLASMGREAIREYEDLARHLSELPIYDRATVLEAESGSVHGESAGGCIIHTHIQWIPDFATHADIFDAVLRLVHRGSSLEDLISAPQPYILVRAALSDLRVYSPEGLRSQAIRRALSARVGRDDWDWGAFPRWVWIEETLRMWRRGGINGQV